MESDYHWLITIGLVTSSVIAVTANFFLLVVFCRRRGLRTVPNRFVINLLITNLLSSILLIPLLLIDQDARSPAQLAVQENETDFQNIIVEGSGDVEIVRTNEQILTRSVPLPLNSTNRHLLCYFAQSTTSFVCTASIFSILLIGINQYFGVIHSLRYHFYVNKCRSTVFIGMSWCIAFSCAILSALTYNDGSLWRFCAGRTQPSETVKALNTAYAFGYFFLVILAPFVAICVIYVCIYTAAHKNSERMRRSASAPLNPYMDYVQVHCGEVKDSSGLNKCCGTPFRPNVSLNERSASRKQNCLPKVHSAPNFFNIDKESAFRAEDSEKARKKVVRTCSDRIANSFINNLRHKISNASVFRYREETRAAKISVLVILMVLVCYIPYGLTLVLSSERIRVNSSQIFNYLSLVLLVFSNILSPFLFGYRNKRVKREICKMFGLLPQQRIPFGERPRRVATAETAEAGEAEQPFVAEVPEVIVTCKPENERKSILKRVCNSTSWSSYKKCNFITVPDSCISGEARGSFSSASTQISTEE